MNPTVFDEMYAVSDDPWGFRTRWYEQRKRELLLATLLRPSYGSTWEMACSNGELAAALAGRSQRLLATDGNDHAVAMARSRLSAFSATRVERRWLPGEWPAGAFDLIVASELGYYLSEDELARLCDRLGASLRGEGEFVACHWRHPIEHCSVTGDEVHIVLRTRLPWPRILLHEEEDFLLEIWSPNPASAAMREGLR